MVCGYYERQKCWLNLNIFYLDFSFIFVCLLFKLLQTTFTTQGQHSSLVINLLLTLNIRNGIDSFIVLYSFIFTKKMC